VIRSFQPGAVMTDPVRDTAKGTVALVKPPAESVSRVREAAERPGSSSEIRRRCGRHVDARGEAPTLMRLIEQAFNYDILGARGFEAAAGWSIVALASSSRTATWMKLLRSSRRSPIRTTTRDASHE